SNVNLNSKFSNHLYFGTVDGILVVKPDLFGKEKFQPKLVIHSIKRFKRGTGSAESTINYLLNPEKKSISLDYSDQSITFTLADLNQFNHSGTQYDYQLKGFNKQWWPLEDNLQITLNNLPRGKYQLLARSRNIENIPLEPTRLLDIRVYPPWWLSTGAYVFYVLLVVVIVYSIYSFQLKRRLDKQEAENLRAMDTFKNNLFTNITHEFRSPLMIILGMMDQIEKRPDQMLKKGSALVKRNGSILLNLINQILELHKLEDGKQEVDLQQGDILPLLSNIFDQFQTYAQIKEQDLRFISKLEQLNMDFDQEKVWRIVSNLLSNAIKYTPEGGQITFSVTKGEMPELKNKHCLILAIQDTGAGIPKNQLPYIFDRYYRGPKSKDGTKSNPGTGIGLSLTKELVSVLNGKIEVNSLMGLGSTFYVFLPITEEAVVKKQSGLEQVDWSAMPQSAFLGNGALQNESLPLALIVEDNPDVVIYLQTSLEGKYRLAVASNGKIGIDKALEMMPDIIISDIMMPEADGFELCERLKEDIKTSHIPIILLTAKTDFESRIQGLKYGADDYLAKPFSQEELEVRMKNILSIRQKLHQRYYDLYSQAPLIEDGTVATAKEDDFIKNLKTIFEKYMDDPDFEMAELCKELFVSQTQLRRKVKALTGRTLSIYLRSLRLQKARHLISSTSLPVKSIGFEVGFTSHSYFSACYNQEFGETPSFTRQKRAMSK
ncbi:MAG: response regulator, partial [Bacteroidota bacterium]